MSLTGPQRVQRALAEMGLSLTVRELADSTRTAAEAAQAVGCPVAAIAKSLVFRGLASNQAVLAIASGGNRVDLEKLAVLAGEGVTKADAEFVRAETGYAIGGVPPFGHLKDLVTFLDRDLEVHETIWAAAGGPFALFGITPSALKDAVGAVWSDLKVD